MGMHAYISQHMHACIYACLCLCHAPQSGGHLGSGTTGRVGAEQPEGFATSHAGGAAPRAHGGITGALAGAVEGVREHLPGAHGKVATHGAHEAVGGAAGRDVGDMSQYVDQVGDSSWCMQPSCPHLP